MFQLLISDLCNCTSDAATLVVSATSSAWTIACSLASSCLGCLETYQDEPLDVAQPLLLPLAPIVVEDFERSHNVVSTSAPDDNATIVSALGASSPVSVEERARPPSARFAPDVVNRWKRKHARMPLEERLRREAERREMNMASEFNSLAFPVDHHHHDPQAVLLAFQQLVGVTWDETQSSYVMPRLRSTAFISNGRPRVPAPPPQELAVLVASIIVDLKADGYACIQDPDCTIWMRLDDRPAIPNESTGYDIAAHRLVTNFVRLKFAMSTLIEYWPLRERAEFGLHRRLLDDFISEFTLTALDQCHVLEPYYQLCGAPREDPTVLEMAVSVFNLFLEDAIQLRDVARLRIIDGCLAWMVRDSSTVAMPVGVPGEVARRLRIIHASFAGFTMTEHNFLLPPSDEKHLDVTFAELHSQDRVKTTVLVQFPSLLDIQEGIAYLASRRDGLPDTRKRFVWIAKVDVPAPTKYLNIGQDDDDDVDNSPPAKYLNIGQDDDKDVGDSPPAKSLNIGQDVDCSPPAKYLNIAQDEISDDNENSAILANNRAD